MDINVCICGEPVCPAPSPETRFPGSFYFHPRFCLATSSYPELVANQVPPPRSSSCVELLMSLASTLLMPLFHFWNPYELCSFVFFIRTHYCRSFENLSESQFSPVLLSSLTACCMREYLVWQKHRRRSSTGSWSMTPNVFIGMECRPYRYGRTWVRARHA